MAEAILANLHTFTEDVMQRVEDEMKADGFHTKALSEEYHPDPERLFEYNYILGL